MVDDPRNGHFKINVRNVFVGHFISKINKSQLKYCKILYVFPFTNVCIMIKDDHRDDLI